MNKTRKRLEMKKEKLNNELELEELEGYKRKLENCRKRYEKETKRKEWKGMRTRILTYHLSVFISAYSNIISVCSGTCIIYLVSCFR